jgi:type I restriction enzyme S subunit
MTVFETKPLVELRDPSRSISYGIVQPGQPVSNGVPIVRVNNFSGNGLDLTSVLRVEPAIEAQYRRSRPRPGDVLLTLVGSIGQVAIAPLNIGGWNLARAVGLIPTADEHHSHWIALALRAPEAQAFIHRNANTTVQATFNLKDLAQLPIPYPSRKAREDILSVFVPLDDKIELNRRMNETLEAMAQAIFRDWFVDFGPVRRKLAGVTDPVAIMGGLMPDAARAAELGGLFPDALNEDGLPFAWPKRCVTDVATVTGGKQLDKAEIQDFGPNPVFGGGGVMGFSTRSNADDFVITVGRVGAYCGQFFCHRGPAWVNNNASLIRPNAGVSAEWLLLNLRATDIDSIKRGAAQPFVSKGDVGKIELSGSETVASAFAEIVGPFFLAREQRDSENRTLAETRDYLLPRLMSGAVGVGEALEKVEDAA